nr:tetratricopeptide repeat protein [Deltaproteobacteria bacterium]
LFCSLCLMATSTEAATPKEIKLAKSHYHAAKIYFDQEQYSKARQMFITAYRLSKKPELLFNVALCYEKIDKLSKAINFFQIYIKKVPGEKKTILARIEKLKKKIKNTHVIINGGVVGADVYVNSRKAGTIPLAGPYQVNPENGVVIKVISEGYHPFVAKIDITPGTTLPITVSMVKDPSYGNQAKKTVKAKIKTKKELKQIAGNKVRLLKPKQIDFTQSKQLVKASKSSSGHLWSHTLIGLGAVALVSSAISGGLAYYNLQKTIDARNEFDVDAYDFHRDESRNYAFYTDVALASGIVFIISGIIVRIFESDTSSVNKSVSFYYDPAFAGIGLAGEF